MKRITAFAVVSGAIVLAASPVSANSPATMVLTEDFVGPGTLAGSVVGSLGQGTNTTVIDSFVPLPGGCFDDEHTSTVTFADGTLVVAVHGTLCPAQRSGTFKFEGTWTVGSGSTGRFSSAAGGGVVTSHRQSGPVQSTFTGTIA